MRAASFRKPDMWWPSLLVGVASFIVGALAPLAVFGGRLARVETKQERAEQDHAADAAWRGKMEEKSDRILSAVYKIAANHGVEV